MTPMMLSLLWSGTSRRSCLKSRSVRDLLLILARRAAELSAEHGVQVLRGFEAAMLRNVGDGRIGFSSREAAAASLKRRISSCTLQPRSLRKCDSSEEREIPTYPATWAVLMP